jgi:hypothetical protein
MLGFRGEVKELCASSAELDHHEIPIVLTTVRFACAAASLMRRTFSSGIRLVKTSYPSCAKGMVRECNKS